MFMTIITW